MLTHTVQADPMFTLRYFKPKDSLPDPKGSLFTSMSPEARDEIARAPTIHLIRHAGVKLHTVVA